MTNREFFTNIANGTITEAEIEFAAKAIEKADASLEAKRAKAAEKASTEDAPLLAEMTALLTADPQTSPDLGAQMNPAISHNKATSLLRKLVAQGVAVQTEIKVPKKGTCKGYSLVVTDAE